MASLLAGLVLALLLAALVPLAGALESMHGLERRLGFPVFAPAAVLLAAILAAWQALRHERQRAAAGHLLKRESARRGSEIQRLAALGQATARALDPQAMRTAINQHLPRLTGANDAWVMIRKGPSWELLAGPPATDAEAAARVAHAEGAVMPQRARAMPDRRPAFPMTVGNTVVGVIGLEGSAAIDEDRQRLIEAAASLIGVAIANMQQFRDVRESGVRDGLTGCWTRTHAREVLDSELRRSRRSKLPLSIILFDLDHFKSINDRYGHLCGDAVLAEVGRRFHEVLRSSDLKCRYGGEEFLGVLPATPLHGAGCVAEELRRRIESEPVVWNNERVHVTASIGVTQPEPGELDMDMILSRADAALYRAKQQGRNQVRFEPDAPPPQPAGRTADAEPPG